MLLFPFYQMRMVRWRPGNLPKATQQVKQQSSVVIHTRALIEAMWVQKSQRASEEEAWPASIPRRNGQTGRRRPESPRTFLQPITGVCSNQELTLDGWKEEGMVGGWMDGCMDG